MKINKGILERRKEISTYCTVQVYYPVHGCFAGNDLSKLVQPIQVSKQIQQRTHSGCRFLDA